MITQFCPSIQTVPKIQRCSADRKPVESAHILLRQEEFHYYYLGGRPRSIALFVLRREDGY
jgi:hypothetical protein